MPGKLKVAVLISGRGSNLQALLDACADPGFPATIVRVVSNEPDAPGLQRAEAAGVATTVIRQRDFPDRKSFEAALDDAFAPGRYRKSAVSGKRVYVSLDLGRHREKKTN